MGCKTSGDRCSGFGVNLNHCANRRPTSGGVTTEFREYPPYSIRGQNYNLPDREANAIMYPADFIADTSEGATDVGPSNCGKTVLTSNCGFQGGSIVLDYVPDELSYDYILSDTWFSFLYDSSDESGHTGIASYYIEEETRGSTVSGNPGGVGDGTTTNYNYTCHPCTAFTCDAASTVLRYTADDLTGDPDCPHPTLFGFGTGSNKIAIQYNALSTTVPNGVQDFSFSYDGVTYTDVWDQAESQGEVYDTTQNPWQSGDEGWSDFEIFEINSGQTKTGLRIKVFIEPIFDDSGASVVFSGTRWTVSELLSPGTGYAVNDTFALSYTHTHPDNTQTNLTVNIKITAVGAVPIVEGQEGFDVLRAGDTLNGHEITRTFHTDIDNFPYHVIYLDGNGSDFTKDTQYTSDRNHIVTVKAGYNIKDRAILVGLYEFLDKSVQYLTMDLDRNAPDTYAELVQPDIDVTVTNGRVTSASITDGGEGWDSYGRIPELEITSPTVSSGRKAVVEGNFSGGVLTSVTIKDQGSGYLDDDPPSIYVRNIYKRETRKEINYAYSEESPENFKDILRSIPDGDLKVSSQELKNIDDGYAITEKERVYQDIIPEIEIKKDPERNRVRRLPQRKFSPAKTAPLREKYAQNYDLRHLESDFVDTSLQEIAEKGKQDADDGWNLFVDGITQDEAVEFSVQRENLVETVQGSLKELPYSSQYTKYMMRQYRADPTTSTTISISLTCTPENEGSAHFTCTAPAGSVGGTTSSTDPETGVTTSVTNSFSMSGLLGPGCQTWTAEGTMKIFNDLTRAAQRVGEATAAYGNPYDQ